MTRCTIYSKTLMNCLNCNDSCTKFFSYQEKCLECPAGRYLDLDTNEWGTRCNTASQIAIDDAQFGSVPICRSFEYYVNSKSENVVEYGTKEYPYRNLGFVFVELLNYHSHSDRNISVYVMENTESYLHVFNNYIVNITYVEIMTYSSNESAIPSKANITSLEQSTLVDSPGTSLNILRNYELRITEAINGKPDITDAEKSKIELSKFVILILRSNFFINKFVLNTQYGSLQEANYSFFPVYLQEKLFKGTNFDFRTAGIILDSSDPLNIHIENIDIDYYKGEEDFM